MSIIGMFFGKIWLYPINKNIKTSDHYPVHIHLDCQAQAQAQAQTTGPVTAIEELSVLMNILIYYKKIDK
jgi:hypothetical protein